MSFETFASQEEVTYYEILKTIDLVYILPRQKTSNGQNCKHGVEAYGYQLSQKTNIDSIFNGRHFSKENRQISKATTA
jgi:hypothetical protein